MTIEEKINNLTMMEQSLSQMISQKKTFQSQLLEIESARTEIKEDAYKIIGNFMFKKNKKELREELEEKKKLLQARIKSFEVQEEKAEKKFKELQEEVLKELSNKKEKK